MRAWSSCWSHKGKVRSRSVPHDGETMFVHGMGGFPMRGYIGKSTSDISLGSAELIYWCFPLLSQHAGYGFGQTACKLNEEGTVG